VSKIAYKSAMKLLDKGEGNPSTLLDEEVHIIQYEVEGNVIESGEL
jgi:hypothetical protein